MHLKKIPRTQTFYCFCTELIIFSSPTNLSASSQASFSIIGMDAAAHNDRKIIVGSKVYLLGNLSKTE